MQGFRGFNKEQTIDFHDRITLLHAPNSYGKTSISEALEWLIYGSTSRVRRADSKDEYKGSYRNLHLADSLTPFVKLVLVDGDKEIEFKGELTENDGIKRYVDGCEVDSWPLPCDLGSSPEPFILQHALKYLLLVRPDERFQGFARLLGLEELDQIQKNVISLCTKPQAKTPKEVAQFIIAIEAIEARVAGQQTLEKIHKNLKKGLKALKDIYKSIIDECKSRVPEGTPRDSILPQLLKIQEEAVGKIFKGRIVLHDYTDVEKLSNSSDEDIFLSFTTDDFIKKYTELIALATVKHVLELAKFFNLGVKLVSKEPTECPFCGQTVDKTVLKHISDKHGELSIESARSAELEEQRKNVLETLDDFNSRVSAYQNRHLGKVTAVLGLESSLERLKKILVPKHEAHFKAVEKAISELSLGRKNLVESFTATISEHKNVITSVNESKEDAVLIKKLGSAVVEYIAHAKAFKKKVSTHAPALSEADQVLKHELDALAGTEDISILIELLEHWGDIRKKFEIEDIINDLKELRRLTDQYAANKMLDAISGELTSEVMEWYGQIRTEGDPDVHFGGFDMERTTKGELKGRRVQIKAKSYGKDLVSAVSSLSESKLNALGLCVSIASNLKGESPFRFLIIDDPIQSWDAEHEVQFIQVVRKLVERDKQVILLSHNRNWVNQVCKGCRTLNGWFYEITGYTADGPYISVVTWDNWAQRLKEVNAIAQDPSANSVKLQQAEEEIRIVVADLASKLYLRIKNIEKRPHNLNSAEVRKMLVECGVKSDLVDKITQTFETTDDSHHAPSDYAAHRQRLNQYHAWAHELASLIK